MERYCNSSWMQIIQLLNSDIEMGLSEKDCEIIRRRKGSNKIDLPDKTKIYKYILNSLKEKYTIIKIIIAILLFVFQKYIPGLIIIGILISDMGINTLYFLQRDKEVSNLQRLNSTETVVIRDGMEKIIKSEELVVGDIVRFSRNSLIPADIRIIKSDHLRVNEKTITGEDLLKEKFENKILSGNLSISDMKNLLFKGSTVCDGSGIGVVIEVGNSTQIGKLLAMFKSANTRKHSFKKMTTNIVEKYLLIFFIIIISVGMFFIISGQDVDKTFFTKALFAIGCMPLSVVAILSYNLIINQYAKDDIEIINFSVFNLVNDIDILFLDKIGAISKEEMVVDRIYVNESIIGKDDTYKKEITSDRLLEISLICNNSSYNVAEGTGTGDLAEVAFLGYAARKKVFKSAVDINNTKLFEIPMDPDKKLFTVVTNVKGRYRANTRGNLDIVLDKCTHIMLEGIERELTDEIRNRIKLIDMSFSTEGLITQGFAYRNFNYQPSKSENIESNMVFVGIAGLENPLIHNIKNDIRNIKDRGIVPILFTEESKLSAITNCLKCEIIRNKNQVVAGIELDSLNQDEFKELVGRVRVFCRVTPEIKAKIVALFVKDGYKVATVGENLNDIPVLNLANVGISKGEATEMVKKISDVYIKDNYLEGLFNIRKYSKEIKTNIQRALKLFFMTVLSELIILSGCLILGQIGIMNFWIMLIVNAIVMIPLSIITVLRSGKEVSIIGMIIRSIVVSIITLISIYKVEPSEGQIIPLIFLGTDALIFTLLNNKVSIRKISNELTLGIVTLFIILISAFLITFINGIIIRDIIIIEIIISIVILLTYEILSEKWQNS